MTKANINTQKFSEVSVPTGGVEFQKMLNSFSLEQFYILAAFLNIEIRKDGKLRNDFAYIEKEMCEKFLALDRKEKRKIVKYMAKSIEALKKKDLQEKEGDVNGENV